MSVRKSEFAPSLLLLLAALTLTGCATKSASTPLVLPPLRIPSPPLVNEPKPPGAYLKRHCELVTSVRQTLKTSPPTSGSCEQHGQ